MKRINDCHIKQHNESECCIKEARTKKVPVTSMKVKTIPSEADRGQQGGSARVRGLTGSEPDGASQRPRRGTGGDHTGVYTCKRSSGRIFMHFKVAMFPSIFLKCWNFAIDHHGSHTFCVSVTSC